MARLAILLNPPGPHIRRAHVESFVKGGTYERMKSYQNTYGRNEQCWHVSVPPFSKRGARGDFILPHTPSNPNIFMTSDIKFSKRFRPLSEAAFFHSIGHRISVKIKERRPSSPWKV